MKKLLLWLADKPTPQIPESWLRYADRYFRKGRHHVGPGMFGGYEIRAWLKHRTDAWEWVRTHDGIQAAIALGY
jgi:hypothetical protein